jgi:hypothetical protein
MFDFYSTRHEGYGGAWEACQDSLGLMPNLRLTWSDALHLDDSGILRYRGP